MRVLALVTDAFGGHGGIAQYNCDFLSALSGSRDIEEVVVLPRLTERLSAPLPEGIRQLPPVGSKIAYSISAVLAAQRHGPLDVVFCGHPYMAPLSAGVAKLIRAPLWVQVHGVDAWDELSFVYRRSLEAADLITAVSRYTRRRLLEWVGIDPSRVKVLPNTVGTGFQPGPKPDYLLERYGLRGKKVVTTVSRLASSEQYKGHDRIIRAFPSVLSDHPSAFYLIVGDGDDRPRLEALVAACGLTEKVHFAGRVPVVELADHFRLADVLAMPSTGEGFGIVFLEAMAAGIHVIGGNRDGSVDPLADGALGWTVDPHDDKDLAVAINSALRTPAALGNYADRFNAEAFADHLGNLVSSYFGSKSKC